MSIEEIYQQRIREIIQVADTLTEWEQGFILGNGNDSSPILERESLSDKQKVLVDRIHKERVQGMDREAAAVISFGDENILAMPCEGKKTYRVAVDRVQIGPVISYAEGVAVVAWLTSVRKENHATITPVAAPAEEAAASEPAKFPGEE